MPVDALAEHPFDLPHEAATAALAARFAHAFAHVSVTQQQPDAPRQGLQVQLNGDLGAGKTAFVRAVLRALGHTGRVRSPTYTLVESYPIPLADAHALLIHHFDLYRFSDAAEWHEAGFDEYLAGQAINLIEWPTRAGTALGVPDLLLDIDILDEGRTLTARAFTAAGLRCLSEVSTSHPPSC